MAQSGSWTLWASGLPTGVFPKLTIAPNHDIYYGLTGNGNPNHGIIYKSSTTLSTGAFTPMPAAPVPPTITNDIQTIICNTNSEPIVGIFRNSSTDPFLFRWDSGTQSWTTSTVDFLPTLGAFGSAIAPNGDIYVGAKWAYVYKSSDGGRSFSRIDESASVASGYPCYYPAWHGNSADGAIYSINVDKNGRVYAGTEGAGIVFSDDAGLTWQPADFFACKQNAPTQKDSTSPMLPLSNTGNLGAIGFTANNDLVFNGTSMWDFNWNSMLGFADMTNHTVAQSTGMTQYFVASGLQITKFVTTSNGRIFLHSGSNVNVQATIGIYTSTDGIAWTLFNNGITSTQTGQAQGSLAVEGDMVYMATTDGKIWRYDASTATSVSPGMAGQAVQLSPNPATNRLQVAVQEATALELIDCTGQVVRTWQVDAGQQTVSLDAVAEGLYFVKDRESNRTQKLLVRSGL